LYYLRDRYFNQGQGRFIGMDKVEGVRDAPATLHRFVYCGNDPVNRIDPSGKEFSIQGLSVTLTTIGVSFGQNAQTVIRASQQITFRARLLLGNLSYGLEHILRRHSWNSGAINVSRFAQGMGHIEIRELIREASTSGAGWRVEGAYRVLEYNFGRTIGTDQAGQAVSWLRLVVNAAGEIITSYPFGGPV
ncbi:MAG: RHS repeat-associated core domain-containing protein, partial [Terriglobia bacterium]